MLRTEAPRRGSMRSERRHILLPLVAIVGLFAVVMLAVSLQGTPQFGPPPAGDTVPPDESVAPTPEQTPALPMEPPPDSPLTAVIGSVLAVLLAGVVAVLVVLAVRFLFRLLRALWSNRRLAQRNAVTVDVTPAAGATAEETPDAGTIRRGIEAALRAIDERSDPGDSIVAAWIGLEESAADAGTRRGSTETPSEFTLRIVGRRAGVAQEIRTLLALYEAVRFGGHGAQEEERGRAAAALRAIQEGWR